MTKISKIIQYLSACYQADNRENGLLNYYGNKIEHRKILTDVGELLTGEMSFYPLSVKYAEQTSKTLQLYRREKELFLGAIFLIKKTSSLDKGSICAPLFLYPASISQQRFLDDEKGYGLTYDHKNVSINIPLLRELLKYSDVLEVDEVIRQLPQGHLTFQLVASICKILKDHKALITEELLMYPTLQASKQLKQKLKEAPVNDLICFELLPVCCIGVMTKSVETRGVIQELEDMVNITDYSAPINAILDGKQDHSNVLEVEGLVPGILSHSQKNALKGATVFPFSVVVGPPGTGKSFTIANIAIEHISRGESVLIASRNDEAVGIIEQKIKKDIHIEGVTLRAGKGDHLRTLKKRLEQLLSGFQNSDLKIDTPIKKQLQNIHRLQDEIDALELQITVKMQKDLDRGRFLVDSELNTSLWVLFKRKYILYSQQQKSLLPQLLQHYEELLEEYQRQISDYIEDRFKSHVLAALRESRLALSQFLKALRARTGVKQENIHSQFNFNVLLKPFPIWLMKIGDAHRVLPLQKELFDLAIIDEASQCDMASILPILQRARRVVFAGDPHQLRHVSFLSQDRQQFLSSQMKQPDFQFHHVFNYRQESILDVAIERASDHNQVSFLNEHFRSEASIISFSNENFYHEKLLIMTQKPTEYADHGVNLVRTTGTRNATGVNITEAQEILSAIRNIIDAQKDLSGEYCDSIGILSPFRAQADYLSRHIIERFSITEIEKHNLMIGTAFSFQGQERDVMFLSFALDIHSHHSAWIHCNKDDIFNVSITRARKRQVIYYSFDFQQVERYHLLRKYLEKYSQGSFEFVKTSEQKLVEDAFFDSVSQELTRRGYTVWQEFVIAGQSIDMLVQKGHKSFGINLIGYPGKFESGLSLGTYRILKRAGMETLALSYVDWYVRQGVCLKLIEKI